MGKLTIVTRNRDSREIERNIIVIILIYSNNYKLHIRIFQYKDHHRNNQEETVPYG